MSDTTSPRRISGYAYDYARNHALLVHQLTGMVKALLVAQNTNPVLGENSDEQHPAHQHFTAAIYALESALYHLNNDPEVAS